MIETPQESRQGLKASELVRNFGPSIYRLLSELNTSKLNRQGKLGSAEIGRRTVRWALEWQVGAVTYRIHVVIRIGDDGRAAFVDRVYVRKEAMTPYMYDGHTPTTLMKQVATLEVDEIRKAILSLWP